MEMQYDTTQIEWKSLGKLIVQIPTCMQKGDVISKGGNNLLFDDEELEGGVEETKYVDAQKELINNNLSDVKKDQDIGDFYIKRQLAKNIDNELGQDNQPLKDKNVKFCEKPEYVYLFGLKSIRN